MRNMEEYILIGQYGGMKWIVGDYATERGALDEMMKHIKRDEERKGRKRSGPPLRITIVKFHAVYEADR